MDKTMEERAFEHYKNGLEFEEKGQYEEAYNEFQEAIILDVNNEKYRPAYERMLPYHKTT